MLNYPQNYQMVKDVSILFYRISSVKLQMALPNLEGKKKSRFSESCSASFTILETDLIQLDGIYKKKSNQNHK